jgi:hypothetical protein
VHESTRSRHTPGMGSMQRSDPTVFTVRLDVRQRSSYLSARCADVPGLHITGADAEDLRRRAMPAIKHLLMRNRHLDVEVSPTDDLSELRVRVLSA